MASYSKRETHMLRIVCDGDGAQTTQNMRFMVGDRELGEVTRFKLGSRDGDGSVGPDEIVMATIEVAVRLG